MATAAGYQGYGSPERAKVDRERRLAELLQQGALDTGPKSLWEGVAQLGKAFIARDAMGRADKAEGEYGDSQRKIFEALTGHMVPDSAGTASVSQAPTPAGDAKARLMAKANPEGTDPNAAMTAPQTGAAPAPAADPNAITKTDLPPISDAVVKATQWAAQQGLDPQLAAQDMQASAAPSPQAQPAPQMQPQAAPQAGVNPTARIAGALMAQPPMQKPPMQPQGQQGQASPENIRAVMMQYGQLTGDWAGALELGKSMQPAAKEYSSVSFGDGGLGAFDPTTGTMRPLIQPAAPKPEKTTLSTEVGGNGNYWTFDQNTGAMKDTGVRAPAKEGGAGSQPSYDFKDVNGRTVAINKANPRDVIDIGPAGSGVPKMTPMQEAVDKNWAGTLVEWADGGSSDFVKQMSQLDYAIGEMEKAVANPGSVELSGPGNNLFPGGLGRAQFGQHGLKVQQAVEEVAQRNLRAVLGPAFTAKEGEGLIARAYDPSMEEGENLKRVRRLYTQMNIAAQQKTDAMNYYNEHGSMMGYQGHIPTLADFEAALDDEDNEAAKASTPKPQGASTYGSIPSAAQVPGQGGFQWGAPTKPAPQAQAQNDTPPPGIDPEDWKYMDPADKAKFRR
jgi:hypothetical protein